MNTFNVPNLPEPIPFGSGLIQAREAHGLTQSALSQASGLSLSAIKSYESGRNLPGARELRELCVALKTSPNKLLFGREDLSTESPGQVDEYSGTGNPDKRVVRASRITGLMTMLSIEEVDSLLTLVTSICNARHGPERVREQMRHSDMATAIGVTTMEAAMDALKTGTDIDATKISMNTEKFFLDAQGDA